jgi:hypothetical protein
MPSSFCYEATYALSVYCPLVTWKCSIGGGVNAPLFSRSLKLRHLYHPPIKGNLTVFEAENTLVRRDYRCHEKRAITRSIRAQQIDIIPNAKSWILHMSLVSTW